MAQPDHAQNAMQSRDDEWFLDPQVPPFEVDFPMPEIEQMELTLFGVGENGSMSKAAVIRDNLSDTHWLARALQHFKIKHGDSFNLLKSKTPIGKALPVSMFTLLSIGKALEEDLLRKQALGADVCVNHGDPLRLLSWSGNEDTGYIFLPNKHLGDAMKKFITRDIKGIPEYDGVEDPEAYGEKCMLYVSNIMEKRFELVEPHLTKYQRKYTKKSMATKRSNTRKNRTIEARFQRSTEQKAMAENDSQ